MLSVLMSNKPICFGSKTLNNGAVAKIMRSLSDNRDGKSRVQKYIKGSLRKPEANTPLSTRTRVATGAALLGIGAICCYGVGISNNPKIIANRLIIWPKYVKDRVVTTFAYFGTSLLITAASSVVIYRNMSYKGALAKTTGVAFFAPLIVMNIIQFVERTLPYTEPFGAKHVIWLGHCGFMAALFAPLCYNSGAIITSAVIHAAMVSGSLSAVAATAPNEQFFNVCGPLAMALSAVIATTISQILFPKTATTARFLSLSPSSLALYGGLLVFSAFLLFNARIILEKSKSEVYDPLSNSIALSSNATNLIVIASVFATSLTKAK